MITFYQLTFYLQRARQIVLLALVLAFGSTSFTASYAQELPPTVSVVEHSSLGNILVGPNGMTLYVLSKETASDLKCVEDCALNWPPLTVTGGLNSSDLTKPLATVTRSTETETTTLTQVVYNGQPLYYWSRDKVPGDVTGDGIGGIWSVARP
jgi:predicted lipoprotein with Yx(FWY)xxD motif